MVIQLRDRSSTSVRLVNGRCKLTFHGIGKAMLLPVGIEVSIELIEKLYAALAVV